MFSSHSPWMHSVNKLLHHEDFVDSLNVVSTFFHAWIRINILHGLLGSFKEEKYANQFGRQYKKKKDKNNKAESDTEPTKTSYNFNLLLARRSCVAKIICLFNQEVSTNLKNPVGYVLAETLR